MISSSSVYRIATVIGEHVVKKKDNVMLKETVTHKPRRREVFLHH